MENLVFLLKLNAHLCIEIESGRSIYGALSSFKINSQANVAFREYKEWLHWFDHLQQNHLEPGFSSHLTENYFQIVKEGLCGRPILDKVKSFELEIMDQIELQIQKELNKLPYILMVPLILFIFPSFLTLILGPLLSEVLKIL